MHDRPSILSGHLLARDLIRTSMGQMKVQMKVQVKVKVKELTSDDS